MSSAVAGTPRIIADRYVVERELGRGGMAVVFLALDTQENRKVAVKVLRLDVATAVSTDRFLREIRLTSDFRHEHILPLYDSGVDGELPYYVMPFVDGETLRQRLTRVKQLPLDDALNIARQIIDAVAYAHARGVLHRDITPANILLADDSSGEISAYVADFGIALALSRAETDRLTSTGIIVGTPEYMSPEQGAGERDLDERSDVYALGAVLYEMLAGEPPFTGPTVQSLLGRKALSRAPSVRQLRPTTPDHVEAAVARALETAPADRFRSAAEFLAALGTNVASTSTPRHGTRSISTQWKRAVWVGCALAAVAVAALVARRNLMSPHSALADATAALQDGRLLEAETGFRRAQSSDVNAERAKASLWLAHTELLARGDSANSWRVAALAVVADTAVLDVSDRVRVRALAALAHGEVAAACGGFRELARADDRASAASLIDCIGRDQIVVPDDASPSRMRFRSDFEEGIRTGQRLLNELSATAPLRAVVLREMVALLFPMRGPVRTGHTALNPRFTFVAFPALRQDSTGETVDFIPYPVADVIAGRVESSAPSHERAVAHDRAILRELTFEWARDFPNDVIAHIELARALELTGELTSPRAGAPAAIDEARMARRLASNERQRLSLALVEARLLVKREAFAEAAALADSTLDQWTSPSLEETNDLSILAALTGRAHRAAQLLRGIAGQDSVPLPNGEWYRPHPQLGMSAMALLAYASLGAPSDSLATIRDRVERQLRTYVAADAVNDVRAALLERPLSLAFPTLGRTSVAGLVGRTVQLVRSQQALAAGDRPRVRRQLDSLEQLRRGRIAATTTLDQTYGEAWLRAAIGDTGKAIRQLDLTLDALPALPPSGLNDVPAAGALGRAIRLREALATRTGDSTTAHRWSTGLAALWRRADDVVRHSPP